MQVICTYVTVNCTGAEYMSQEIAECNCLYHRVSSQARTQGGSDEPPI